MENYITIQHFYWVIGGLVGLLMILLGYWINEIRNIKKDLEYHIVEDDKEFSNSERTNDLAHAEIRQMISTKTDSLSKDISNIDIKLGYILESLKKLENK